MITLDRKSKKIVTLNLLLSQNWQIYLLSTGNCYFEFMFKPKLTKVIILSRKLLL